MDRRKFMGQAGCGLAGFMAAGGLGVGQEKTKAQDQTALPSPPVEKLYKIDIEIFEARTDTWCHKKGDKFVYPDDLGKICPWLRGSLNDVLVVLDHGVTLPWKYEGTPYEKVIDPNGVTTEFVRCPDPTSNLVVKITRTLVKA